MTAKLGKDVGGAWKVWEGARGRISFGGRRMGDDRIKK